MYRIKRLIKNGVRRMKKSKVAKRRTAKTNKSRSDVADEHHFWVNDG